MVATLFVSLGRKRLKLDPKYKPLRFFSAKINGVNVVVIKGSNSHLKNCVKRRTSRKSLATRPKSLYYQGRHISRDVVTRFMDQKLKTIAIVQAR